GPLYEIFEYNPMWLIWMCSLSLLILLVLTLFMGAHFILHMTGKVKGMSTALRIICLTVWMIALIIFSASSTKIISRVSIQHDWHRYGVEDYEDRIQRKEDRKINNLLNAGWNLTRGENLSDYTKAGGHFSGDDKIRYLHASRENSSMLMEYEVDRTQKVAPGLYTLHAIGRTNGQGAEIFAIDANGKRLTAEIPICGNEGGSLWHDAKVALDADTAMNRSDRGYLQKIAKSNDGKGYGWSSIEIDSITVGPDSIVRYGVTNLSNNKTWDGTWLSATSFELRRKETAEN
ncbi:MAG: hypothetical protein K2L11_11605, partial [Muribaculaceae bacterium]|nr:hypothetical protein [Muribaculaceae bacterium]